MIVDKDEGHHGLPSRHDWLRQDSFGAITVRDRFPKIISELDGISSDSRRSLEKWIRDLRVSKIIPESYEQITPYIVNFLEKHRGESFECLSFMHLEFLFYHSINSNVGAYRGLIDPFSKRKRQATMIAAESLNQKSDVDALGLHSLIAKSLIGNLRDLSQVYPATDTKVKLVVDERRQLGEWLQHVRIDSGCRRIGLIADNAGEELLSDLLLIVFLLNERFVDKIVLFLKPWPMFVSDATVSDLNALLYILAAAGSKSNSAAIGRTISRMIENEQLIVRDQPDWGEPRDFDCLSIALKNELAECAFLISKGDLNYRRHFGDRTWLHCTPINQAGAQIPFRSALLRVCKSEIAVGLYEQATERLDPDWATGGKYGMIQLLGTSL